MRQHVPALDSGRVAKKSSGIGSPGFWLQLRTYIRSMSMLPPACRQAPIFYGDAWFDRKRTGKGVREVRRRRQPFSIEFASANSGRSRYGLHREPSPSVLSSARQNEGTKVTYCVAIMLDKGMIFASDSRTHAGVDNFAKFCKMTVFDRGGDRVIVLLSSGDLAGTQAVISVLKQRGEAGGAALNLWNARTMFDVANLVADAMRDIERRDGPYLAESDIRFNASFVLGGQINGESMRLFRIYAEGNFIEAGLDTTFFQTGETKYGKPILDRVITRSTPLADAAKCVLVSFDSTMRSNLSVGMPIDLICYEKGTLEIQMRRRFDEGDAYFTALSRQWSEGVRYAFSKLPEFCW